MNFKSQLFKKLSRLILFGFSAGILLAVFAQPLNLQLVSADEEGGDSASQVACGQTGTYYAKLGENGTCQQFTNVCIQPGWINCSNNTPSSQPSCEQLAGSYGYCGERTYNQCTLRYDGNLAYYDCQASQNSSCQGSIRCQALDRSQPPVENIPPQAPVNSQCILGGANQANYPGPTGSSQWCDCAVRNNDTGSLMRENCSQAPRDVQNPTQPARTCDDFAGNYGICGQRTYDQCSLRYEGNQAFYDCHASQNASCQGVIRCSTLDRGAGEGGTGGPATAAVNCPTGTVPTTGVNQNTVVCVSQAQSQVNNQTQTAGNQTQVAGNQTVTTGAVTTGAVTAYGGSGGAGGYANVIINGVSYPAINGQRVVYATNGNVGVGTSGGQRVVYVQDYSGAKELPKTGLPALAWAAMAFLPAGMKMRKFYSTKEDFNSHPTYLWEQRRFKVSA